MNNPVMFVDPDGRDVWIYYRDNEAPFKYYGQEMDNMYNFYNSNNDNDISANIPK